MEPRVGSLGASHEEDEGLKEPGWGMVGSDDCQEDALMCPSCSWMSLSWLKERRRQGTGVRPPGGDITRRVLECHSLYFLMGSPLWAEKE